MDYFPRYPNIKQKKYKNKIVLKTGIDLHKHII